MNELARLQLDREKALLLVIDVQEKLVVTMEPDAYRQMLDTLEMLLGGMDRMGIPAVVTEQYPRGLGSTVPELEAACRQGVVEKVSFGCCGEPAFLEKLKSYGRSQIVVTGMEAHVCVYQTVLGLLEAGFHVHVVGDGVISRRENDLKVGLDSAARAGAVVTTAEIVLFQLMQSSKTPEFKEISALIKNRG